MLKRIFTTTLLAIGCCLIADQLEASAGWGHHRHHCDYAAVVPVYSLRPAYHRTPYYRTPYRAPALRYRAPVPVGIGIGSPYRSMYRLPYRGYGYNLGGYHRGIYGLGNFGW
ncbi:hypothetical protein LF1_11850 [Rubripirellula obstinata]|uniref:Uncharacterized protein n=1 Tax=Rubripirellula obstinata TaxID=406547 RepID=A0A5B1CGL1_9BACT|nr:hypothetical protein [Rubripirellula obstinata]KAA1258663.1 hypothetical protein LF1_11850 [Rubripirellula obstinata]